MENAGSTNNDQLMRHTLIICSGGGHWVQMKRILPALSQQKVSVATVDLACVRNAGIEFISENQIPDFNRKDPLSIVSFFPNAIGLIRKLKPTHVISTGAAPGIVVIVIARLMGCRTLWIDSVANTKKRSLSGRLACLFANNVFTQWEHLDRSHGARYFGRVI